MTDLRRGDVWLVDLGEPVGHEQAGRRPSVILSNDIQNSGPSGIVVVIPVTTMSRRIPSHIELDPDRSGMDEISYATCEHVTSISVERVIHRLGSVDPAAMFEIGKAIRILLDV